MSVEASITCDRCGKVVPCTINMQGQLQASDNVSAITRQVLDTTALIEGGGRAFKLLVRHLCTDCLDDCHAWIEKGKHVVEAEADKVVDFVRHI